MVDQYAPEQSQAEQIRALQDILGYLLKKAEHAEMEAQRAKAQAERAALLGVSNQAQIEQNAARVRDAARLAQIIQQAPEAAEVNGPHHHAQPRRPTPKRDRHGLHAVQGVAAAALCAAGRWSWRAGAHRAITSIALVAAAGSATVAAPSLMMGPPAPAHAAVTGAPHHRHHGHHSPASWPAVPGPRLAAHHHARRRPAGDGGSSPSREPSPSAPASPLPSASATPVATAPPTLPPSPGPTSSPYNSSG